MPTRPRPHSGDPVRRHGRPPRSGVVALGALPFVDAMAGYLVIPRFAMGISPRCGRVHPALGHRRRPGGHGAPRHRRALRRRDLAVRHHARSGRRASRHRPLVLHVLGRLPRHGGRCRLRHAPAGRHAAQGGPVSPRHTRARRTAPALGRAASPPCWRAQLHDLLHAGPRRGLLRCQPRTPRGPSRRPGLVPSPGRHRASRRHRTCRRGRPTGPGPVLQEPRGTRLRGRRDRRDAQFLLRRAVGARRALHGRVPFGRASRHEDRGAPPHARRRARAA